MATITEVMEANQIMVMVTDNATKVVTITIHTISVMVAMAETNNITARIVNKMHVIVVHV